jgi:hypothetical protein
MTKLDLSRIRFDRHARRRMKWRGISEEEVYFALEDPDKVEEGQMSINVAVRTLIISVVDKG